LFKSSFLGASSSSSSSSTSSSSDPLKIHFFKHISKQFINLDPTFLKEWKNVFLI
jgi:hypothetical protein